MRFFLIFAMTVQPAWGAVLIQGPAVPPLEFRAALKADPDLISPSQQLIKQRPSAAQRELLLTRFASAQKSFLDNSKEEAAVQFQNVAAMMTADDWARADRQVFLHSYLRLAQMELAAEKQNIWLAHALRAGDDITPEAGLFPPPLLRTLANLRREVPRESLPKNIFSEGWNVVLLNGSACSVDECPGAPSTGEKIRATFLSDTWQPVTVIVEPGALKSFKPARTAWVTGDCSKTQFSAASLPFKDPKAFWGLACESAPAKIDLNPVAQTQTLPVMDIKEKSPAFYKSKWFWGGVALAAAAAIIVNGQKRKEEKEPTTTYGYQ